ncbi:hypothetical protein D3C78_1559580 [compost metagenome]
MTAHYRRFSSVEVASDFRVVMVALSVHRTHAHSLLESQLGGMFHRGDLAVVDPVTYSHQLANELLHVLAQFLVGHVEAAVVCVLVTDLTA